MIDVLLYNSVTERLLLVQFLHHLKSNMLSISFSGSDVMQKRTFDNGQSY